MNQLKSVLIIGGSENGQLIDALFDLGLTPLIRNDMHRALTKLRREKFEAVIIDLQNTNVDTLEFILNVRDIVDQTPIVIVGELGDENEDRAIKHQQDVYIIPDSSIKLKRGISQILLDQN